MADSKITALTAISTVDPAADPLVIVDVSDTSMAASGTTKKGTINQLLGAGGTATLASATITGDLTVDTSTLKVDSTNNRVGIGTASPAETLHVSGGNIRMSINQLLYLYYGSATNYASLGADNSGNVQVFTGLTSPANRFQIANDGVCTWSNVGGVAGTAMTLNANGLGIGVTPSAWISGWKAIDISTAGAGLSGTAAITNLTNNCFLNASAQWIYKGSFVASRYQQSGGEHQFYTATAGTGGLQIGTFTQAMTLDASGNLLVGTTGLNGSWNTKLTLSNDSGTTKWAVGPYLGGVTNFLISAGASAGVYLNGTAATSWTSASDERLKDIIEPISDAIAKVGSLRAVIGKFKFDQNNTRKPFLIAQDIQSVLPEAVDASNPEKLGVAYTDIIPLLVAAIKELTAEVNALKNA